MSSQGESERLATAIVTVAERLIAAIARDGELRAGLRAIAESLLAIALEPGPSRTAPGPSAEEVPAPREEPPASPTPDVAPGPIDPLPARPDGPLPKLLLGQVRPKEPDSPSPWTSSGEATTPTETSAPGREIPRSAWASFGESTTPTDLPTIAARCRLKAEGSRWASTRQDLLAGGADFRTAIAPIDRDLLDRARSLPSCLLWMNTPSYKVPADRSAIESMAVGFEALAEAVDLAELMEIDLGGGAAPLLPALDLIAEAQSALRTAVERAGGAEDQDQYLVHLWIKKVAAVEQVFVRRFMKRDDRADPAGLPAVRDRVRDLSARTRDATRDARRRRKGLGKLKHLAAQVGRGEDLVDNWRKVVDLIDELVVAGVPPSNPEIRESLLPILDDIPESDTLPRNVALVLRELDRYAASRPIAPAVDTRRDPSPVVEEAAALLEGKSVLLIGGVRRPDAHAALASALRLGDLIWFETREHESIDVFLPSIARPEVALVLLAIRWSSHSFGEVKRFCEEYGKPLVRLPAGYNPNQVAAQILAQCSRQLGA